MGSQSGRRQHDYWLMHGKRILGNRPQAIRQKGWTTITYVDIQSSWGFICCWVTDEHRLQAIGELQSSVNPFVLRRANYVPKHPFHSWVGHFEWQGWHQPAVRGIQFEFSQKTVLQCSEILGLFNVFLVRHRYLKYLCDIVDKPILAVKHFTTITVKFWDLKNK